jgi:hypothetical protein
MYTNFSPVSLPGSSCVQVRSLSFNLKDPANPDLRARVLQGEIDPQVRRGISSICGFVDMHMLTP